MRQLTCENLSFSYGGKKILNDVNLSASLGEIVGITGNSGAGKSTLIYILSGVIPRSLEGEYSGVVRLFDKNILQMTDIEVVTKVGVVFQNPDTQIFSLTVADEIAFGMENLNFERDKMQRTITKLLNFVGLQGCENVNPQNLSGGQKQLVALCSTLALEPNVLFFDEAMSMLDDESVEKILKLMVELKNDNKLIVIVEHNKDRLEIADRIYNLSDGTLTVTK